MNHNKNRISICLMICFLFAEPFDGLTLITTGGGQGGAMNRKTILIDNDENIINTWNHETKASSIAYLSPDSILFLPCRKNGNDEGGPGGGTTGGRFIKKQWNGDTLWDYELSEEICIPHHDISILPNGNILAICSETKTQQEGISAGKQNLNGSFTLDMLIEIEPVGDSDANIVWEWHFWDHLIQNVSPDYENYGIISNNPQLLDINSNSSGGGGGNPGVGDWNHLNCVSYNSILDQIVISSRHMNEFYVIDHSTTIGEAASHSGGIYGKGGDFLFRWGNPTNYDRGSIDDQILSAQHGVNWIPQGYPGEGNFILYNNNHSPNSSAVLEIMPPMNEDGTYFIENDNPYGPVSYHWIYQAGFYSNTQSGAFRLPNGNTIISSAQDQQILEVSMNGGIQWVYQGDDHTVRALKYSYDYFQEDILGDLNNDEIINILDVIMMVNIILDINNFSENADINEDSIVDILDIVLLINLIL